MASWRAESVHVTRDIVSGFRNGGRRKSARPISDAGSGVRQQARDRAAVTMSRWPDGLLQSAAGQRHDAAGLRSMFNMCGLHTDQL